MFVTDVKIKKLRKDAVIPRYGTENSAGADLCVCLEENVEIKPNETKFLPTGLAMEIPEGLGGFIYARSGLSCKQGLAPANKVAVIDSDYRGEIMIALHNHSTETKTVEPGQRIAQIVFAPYYKAKFVEVESLEDSERGTGGFGSTGKK